MYAEPDTERPVGDWDADFARKPSATIDIVGREGARMRVSVTTSSRMPAAQLDEVDRPDDILSAADAILTANGYQREGAWVCPSPEETPFAQLKGEVPYYYGSATVSSHGKGEDGAAPRGGAPRRPSWDKARYLW